MDPSDLHYVHGSDATEQRRLSRLNALLNREGDAVNLPLADDEWGTFDVVHARFLLEHVTDPLAVVRSMVRAGSVHSEQSMAITNDAAEACFGAVVASELSIRALHPPHILSTCP